MLVSSTTSLTMKMSRERERGLLRFLLVGFLMLYVSRVRVEKKYRYPDSQYQSSLEKSSYICVVLLYCTTTWYFLSWTRSRAWRVSQRRSWKDLVLLTTTPQLTFFITQTQDGLWNIVHSCFFIFHMMMSKRVLHTYTGQARSKKKRKNSY